MYYDLIIMSITNLLSLKNLQSHHIATGIAIITMLITLIKFWNNIKVNSAITFEYKYFGNNIVYGLRHFRNIIGIILLSLLVVAASDIFKVYPPEYLKEQYVIYGIISIMSVLTYVMLYKFFITSNIDYYCVDKKSGQKLYYRYINQNLNIVYYTMTSNKTDKRYITKTIEEDMGYVKEWEYRKDGISLDNLRDELDKKDKITLILYILIGIGTLLYAKMILSLSTILTKLDFPDILIVYLWMQCTLLAFIFIPYICRPIIEMMRRLNPRMFEKIQIKKQQLKERYNQLKQSK